MSYLVAHTDDHGASHCDPCATLADATSLAYHLRQMLAKQASRETVRTILVRERML